VTEACPCHSGLAYAHCCQPLHEGRPALTPEALMRSRYSAYALGDARHLIRTTDPEGPHYRADRGSWRADLEAYSAAAQFVGLEIVSTRSDADIGFVHFRASIRTGAGVHVQEEHSRFRRKGRSWVYTDAMD
jgi:SEC-C motif domain protein